MRKRIEWKWEPLDDFTSRAKIVGGWLVRTESVAKSSVSCSMIFVQDKDHEWAILAPKPPVVDESK